MFWSENLMSKSIQIICIDKKKDLKPMYISNNTSIYFQPIYLSSAFLSIYLQPIYLSIFSQSIYLSSTYLSIIPFLCVFRKRWPVTIKANYRSCARILFTFSLTLGKLCDWLNVQKLSNHR